MSWISRLLSVLLLPALAYSASTIHLNRSLSGPSDRVAGAKFVFDSTRNRFVFPQDKSFVVYFEWTAPAGVHVLTGIWKGPNGRTASMSPDVKLETTGEELHSYWTFEISLDDASGFWSLDVQVDGEPAGSHIFEMVIPKTPPSAKAPAPPAHPTDNEIYKTTSHSLVWVHALDDLGRKMDSSLGFINAVNSVATSFQAIDGASRLEIEFANGRRERTDVILNCSRVQDWAVIQANTESVPPLPIAANFEPKVGEFLRTFNVEAGSARVMAKVAITGQRNGDSPAGVTLFNPALSAAASGAPALDEDGRVFGILGGSLTPGAHIARLNAEANLALWSLQDAVNAAVPVGVLQTTGQPPANLAQLLATGVLTPPLVANPTLVWGSTTDSVSKKDGAMERTVTEFSRKQKAAWVVTIWERKAKVHQAVLAGGFYDAFNKKRFEITAKKFGFGDLPSHVAFPFSPMDFAPGIYRVDITADDKVAYRSFITVRE